MINMYDTGNNDFKKVLDSSKFMLSLKGIDDWLRRYMSLPDTLFGIKDGITTVLMNDGPVNISFSSGEIIQANTVTEIMTHMGEDLVDITILETNVVILKDDYNELTDILPDNVLSLALIGSLLMFNTLDNSRDRSIYFRGGKYEDGLYPMRLADTRTIEELLGVELVNIVHTYSTGTSISSAEAINLNLKAHSNYNMLRYHTQVVMDEIRQVEAGIDVPDNMWELLIVEGQLYVTYMGNPHMYRWLGANMHLNRVDKDEAVDNPDIYGLPSV